MKLNVFSLHGDNREGNEARRLYTIMSESAGSGVKNETVGSD